MDNPFVLQQLIEKRSRILEETQLASVDFEKAYDSIPRSKLWQILLDVGIEPELIELVKELYEGNKAYVNIGKTLSDTIVPTKGRP